MSDMLVYGGQPAARLDMSLAALEMIDVSTRYPGADRLALQDITLCVPPGARVALVGPNGAGKSTLLKAVAGLLPVTSGIIHLFGQPLAAGRQRIAYLPQRGELDWQFPISMRKLVLTGRYVHLGWLRWPGAHDWAIADRAIEQMQLSELAERQIGQLSGGQQQRAMLARALAQEADVLLLDEPLNAIDSATRQVIADMLLALHRQGKTIIAAIHEPVNSGIDFDTFLYLADGREVHPDHEHTTLGRTEPYRAIS